MASSSMLSTTSGAATLSKSVQSAAKSPSVPPAILATTHADLAQRIEQLSGKKLDVRGLSSPDVKELSVLLVNNQAAIKSALESGGLKHTQLADLAQLKAFVSHAKQKQSELLEATNAHESLRRQGFDPSAVVAVIGHALLGSKGGFQGHHTISREGLKSLACNKGVDGKLIDKTIDKLIQRGVIQITRTDALGLASRELIKALRDPDGKAIDAIVKFAQSDKALLEVIAQGAVDRAVRESGLIELKDVSMGPDRRTAHRTERSSEHSENLKLDQPMIDLVDGLEEISSQWGPAPLPAPLKKDFEVVLQDVQRLVGERALSAGSIGSVVEGISRVHYHRLSEEQRGALLVVEKQALKTLFDAGPLHRVTAGQLSEKLLGNEPFYRNGAFVGALLEFAHAKLTSPKSLHMDTNRELGRQILINILGVLEKGDNIVQPGLKDGLQAKLKALRADRVFRDELDKALSDRSVSVAVRDRFAD